MPNAWRRPSVSLAGTLEGFGVSGEHAPHPIGIVGELLEGFDGEGDWLTVFVVDTVPADQNSLEQVVVALGAELGKLGAAQALEGGVESAGVEHAAVGGLFDVDRPLEGFDLLTNERHKLLSVFVTSIGIGKKAARPMRNTST